MPITKSDSDRNRRVGTSGLCISGIFKRDYRSLLGFAMFCSGLLASVPLCEQTVANAVHSLKHPKVRYSLKARFDIKAKERFRGRGEKCNVGIAVSIRDKRRHNVQVLFSNIGGHSMISADNKTIRCETVSFKTSASIIRDAQEIFDAHDLSMQAAIDLFFEACVKQGRIPDAILNQNRLAAASDSGNTPLSSAAASPALPNCVNQITPSGNSADEIMLEFFRSVFRECYEPWWNIAQAIIDVSSWSAESPGDEGASDYEKAEFIRCFMPNKYPYDYALGIVEKIVKNWVKAEEGAKPEWVDISFDAIMGSKLKHSHLTLDVLMTRLMEADIVEGKHKDSFNRSLGRMAENLVAYLKKNEYWSAPERKHGIPFNKVERDLVDKVIDELVAFRVNFDCVNGFAHEHPVALMFEDLYFSICLALENSYISLFDPSQLSALKGSNVLSELDGALMFTFDDCKFKNPPKVVYDECRKRYLDAMEAAEFGTIAAKCLPHAKAPFNLETDRFYSRAIDMDAEVWAEVYSREVFFAVAQAVKSGALSKRSMDSDADIRS